MYTKSMTEREFVIAYTLGAYNQRKIYGQELQDIEFLQSKPNLIKIEEAKKQYSKFNLSAFNFWGENMI